MHIAEDRRAIRINLPLNWRTRNICSTLFGGSVYAATNLLYALLVKGCLGPGYVVWDNVGAIRYRKPGRSTLYAECTVSEAILNELRLRLETEPSAHLDYEIEPTDVQGVVHASVMKTIYVARQETYLRKRSQEKAASPA
jgi:hypothetical protein